MRIGVTGAGGFIGSGLVAELLARGRLSANGAPIDAIVATDTRLPERADRRLQTMGGDIADPTFRAALFEHPFDAFFHLAAIPGGAAAADYGLGWRVNVEATAGIFEALSKQASPARTVFASSIAVFGVPLPKDKVDDQTLPLPTMTYGGQKLVGETLLADFTHRGLIDGVGIRLPGIVARPRVAGGHLSAYMSNIFHALAAGEAFTCPVSAGATAWFMSRACCVDNLIHAASLPSGRLGSRRNFNLPALRLSTIELVEGIAAHFGKSVRDRITYVPDEKLEQQFGSYPPLATPIADGLGFLHDGSAATLVERALELSAGMSNRGAA